MKAWIARDADGKVFLYKIKPRKGIIHWDSKCYFHITELPEGVNPHWKDEEPIEVELKIEGI